jgi:hypothetical protein
MRAKFTACAPIHAPRARTVRAARELAALETEPAQALPIATLFVLKASTPAASTMGDVNRALFAMLRALLGEAQLAPT